MKRFLWTFIFLMPSVWAAPVAQLTQLLGGYSTYSANYIQTTQDDSGMGARRIAGYIALSRPDKSRLETKGASKDVMIINGRLFWHYDAGLMQATKQRLTPAQLYQNPAFLLAGRVNHIANYYHVARVRRDKMLWFLLTPKSKATVIHKIYFHFDGGRLTELATVNNLNEKSLFQFSNIQINKPLPRDLFSFVPPKGVDVLNQT